jgi:choline dehydrogenase-like flavoprotein
VNSADPQPIDRDDRVIVIGSGPCGAMAAAALVERGIAVTMLDAGVEAPKGMLVRAAGNTMYRKTDELQIVHDRHDVAAGSDVEWHSSLSPGGLSNYWTASVPRFAPHDFSEGSALDERYRWPISYDDLAPYYEQAERRLVVTAGEAFANIPSNVARYHTRLPDDWAALAANLPATGSSLGSIPMAKGAPWMVARRATEFSSYHCIVAPMLGSPHFRLVPGAQVTRLVWSPTSGKVDSVTYVDRRTGDAHELRGRAVVVAAGAIDSAVLLLRSVSSDFPDGLGNTAGVIGRYLHDHPREWWSAASAHPMTALAHPAYLSRGPYDEAAPLMATSLTFGLTKRTDRLRTYVRAKSPSFGVQVFGTMVPTPDLGVTIPPSHPADAVECRPLLSLAYDQAALDNMVAARSRLHELFAASGVTVKITSPFHDLVPGSSVHFGGTVRMHARREFGALDAWNRLHDVPNVIVCDSSCFTTGPEKNPTLTAMAIAARAADRLAADLGARPGPTGTGPA